MVLPSFITQERLMCTSPQEWSFISNKASSMTLYRDLLSKNRKCCLPKASHSALLTKRQNKQTSCPLVKPLHPSHKFRWKASSAESKWHLPGASVSHFCTPDPIFFAFWVRGTDSLKARKSETRWEGGHAWNTWAAPVPVANVCSCTCENLHRAWPLTNKQPVAWQPVTWG